MKERVKVFVLKTNPTAREQGKELGPLIEGAVNSFIGQDNVVSAEISISTDLSSAFQEAVVIIKYLLSASAKVDSPNKK